MNKPKMIFQVFLVFFIQSSLAQPPVSGGVPALITSGFADLEDAITSAINDSTVQLTSTILDVQNAIQDHIDTSLANSVDVLQNYITSTVQAGVDEVVADIRACKDELMVKICENNDLLESVEERLHRIECHLQGNHFFNGSCYIFGDQPATQEDARVKCQQLGGDLVVIESQDEYDFIVSVMDTSQHHYIGLSDIDNEGIYVWVDGTDFDPTFINWFSPGQIGGIDPDDCITISKYDQLLFDERCTNTYLYVCEVTV